MPRVLINCFLIGLVCIPAAQSPADEPRPDDYLFPAKDVDPAALKSGDGIVVTESAEAWGFAPANKGGDTALLFFPGGGVDPKAYAPLARAVAADRFAVHVAKLPGKPAAPDTHRRNAIETGKTIIGANPATKRWVVAGHSMGATIAARFAYELPGQFRGLVLIGTTHPRDFDLSNFKGDVTKVYATEDSVASQSKSEANRKLLPASTTWVRVEGGNHAQFGCYGPQPGDGSATISREAQQQVTHQALAQALGRVAAEKSGGIKIQYLEIVTTDVAGACALYSQMQGVTFGDPDPNLGGARTAKLADGGMLGIRAPLRDTEGPVVRPYLLVEDIKSSCAAATAAGAAVAVPPTEIPGYGTFAIVVYAGIESGLWQL